MNELLYPCAITPYLFLINMNFNNMVVSDRYKDIDIRFNREFFSNIFPETTLQGSKTVVKFEDGLCGSHRDP